RGLEGHSDADVLLHAVCDAILGAAGMGDIGVHFPDHDPSYKDISSLILLAETWSIIKKRFNALINLDATVFAESPRIAPYADSMKIAIAKTLNASPDQVNIKATTAEGLGFIGKSEGIAAMAVALID
nr:2-C-methyl-D-erythritol 2,4-cyclodiphosphate synthase [Desulfobacterales bacterium]